MSIWASGSSGRPQRERRTFRTEGTGKTEEREPRSLRSCQRIRSQEREAKTTVREMFFRLPEDANSVLRAFSLSVCNQKCPPARHGFPGLLTMRLCAGGSAWALARRRAFPT